MSTQPLRPYQEKGIAEARDAYRAGKRAILIVAPTGAGKTRLGVEIVSSALRRASGAVLWLAHRAELLGQARDRLLAEGIDRVGLIASGERMINARVQVASVQTLAARIDRGLPPASVVVFDEAHHYKSDLWAEVAAGYKGSAILGLTATPERGDGRALGDLFDHVVSVSSVRELQATIDPVTGRAVLVPCLVWRPSTKTKALSQEPVAAYLTRTPGERAFCFCANVKHAEMVAATFRERGVQAATIHADTPWLLRRARIEAFRLQSDAPLLEIGVLEPAPLVLCNVYCLTEGVDVPEASVCIIARGCGHVGMYLQMVGRVLRSAAGKERAVLLDLRGVSHMHQLPEADRVWSLDGKPITLAEGEKDRPPRDCKTCGAVFAEWATRPDGSRVCPSCGEAAPPQEMPKVSPRELQVAGTAASKKDRDAALRELAEQAVSTGKQPGWIAHRMRERFGKFPRFGVAQEAFNFARAGGSAHAA